MNSPSKPLRLALIGCGAAARLLHAPAIGSCGRAVLAAVVDRDGARAGELAARTGGAAVRRDHREVIGQVDAAIIALPNNLHAPVAIDLLQHGVHVLVEKPMALTAAHCRQMIDAAAASGACLAVGMVQRFYLSSQWTKRALACQTLGRVESFDLRLGNTSSWEATTDYFLRKEQAGGGVLINHGVHLLDLLLWWLGDYEQVSYRDDALGGIEADCEMRLRLRSGATGTVEVSRTRNLRNTCRIAGERGTIEVTLWNPNGGVFLTWDDDLSLRGAVTYRQEQTMERTQDVFRRQLEDFIEAIIQQRPPLVSGAEGQRAIQLIEACYAAKIPLDLPWARIEEAERWWAPAA